MPRVLGVEVRHHGDLLKELGHGQPLAPLGASVEADLAQRAVNEIPERHEAPAKHHPGAPVDGDRALSQGLEREERRVQRVAELVRDLPAPLVFLRPGSPRGNAGVLRHSFRDGRVEAAIQDAEFLDPDRRPLFEGQLGDRLADVAIVVDHLGHIEPKAQ